MWYKILIAWLLCVTEVLAQGVESAPGVQLQDEGTGQGRIQILNCVGAGVACTKSGVTGVATIAGGSGSVASLGAVGNLGIVASVAANALTIAVKTLLGNDPSGSDTITIPFRSVNLNDGSETDVVLSSALSIVVSSGSTLGTQSAIPHRIYIALINNGGTPLLGVFQPMNSTLQLIGLRENEPSPTTAEGGAGAADSAFVLYASSTLAAKAIRIIGYIESTQATAGTWVTAPSAIVVQTVGGFRTGQVVQHQVVSSSAVATGTTAIPIDDTIPQITEGNEYFTNVIGPYNSTSVIRVSVRATLAQSNGANSIVLALFRDAVTGALTATAINGCGANQVFTLTLGYEMVAASTTSITFRVRAGNATGATTTLNGAASARLMGGVANSYIVVEEIWA